MRGFSGPWAGKSGVRGLSKSGVERANRSSRLASAARNGEAMRSHLYKRTWLQEHLTHVYSRTSRFNMIQRVYSLILLDSLS